MGELVVLEEQAEAASALGDLVAQVE